MMPRRRASQKVLWKPFNHPQRPSSLSGGRSARGPRLCAGGEAAAAAPPEGTGETETRSVLPPSPGRRTGRPLTETARASRPLPPPAQLRAAAKCDRTGEGWTCVLSHCRKTTLRFAARLPLRRAWEAPFGLFAVPSPRGGSSHAGQGSLAERPGLRAEENSNCCCPLQERKWPH
ncbi:hypothetical protein Q9966_012024 [Columba livia]|nr:hypothetical protein Q9966_012024 [Columba livia]